MLKSLILFNLLIAGPVLANETDAFKARLEYDKLPEIGALIDSEITTRMSQASTQANRSGRGCDSEELMDALGSELRQIFWGKIEMWAVFNKELEGVHTKIEDSIYQNVPAYKKLPTHLPSTLGMAKTFKIDGRLISSDKMGHFMDEGFAEYKLLLKNDLSRALQYGDGLEKGFFGSYTTGIISYADEVANFNGMIFWNSILPGPTSALKKESYFKCEDNQWVLTRPFQWSEYVDDGWDESINCNEYVDTEYTQIVIDEIRKLERQSGRRMTCPSTPKQCEDVKEKYKGLEQSIGEPIVSELISPICRRMPKASLIVPWEKSQHNPANQH